MSPSRRQGATKRNPPLADDYPFQKVEYHPLSLTQRIKNMSEKIQHLQPEKTTEWKEHWHPCEDGRCDACHAIDDNLRSVKGRVLSQDNREVTAHVCRRHEDWQVLFDHGTDEEGRPQFDAVEK